MPASPRALLLIPHLNGGGAARVTRNLALGLSRHGYDVHLVILTAQKFDPESLPGISVHCIGASRVRWGMPALLRIIRKLHPDLILSNMAHLNLAVLALRPFVPGNTRILVRNDGGIRPEQLTTLARAIWKRLHNRADAILCQSENKAAELAVALDSSRLLRTLPNPVDVEKARGAAASLSRWNGPGPHLLAMGRLVRSKGFDLLLSASATVAFRFPDAQLALLGEGPEMTGLQRLAGRLGITDRVLFAGQVSNPETWFSGATLYVQPSREDALPNALLEAAAAGLPIVTTPARGGIPALLRNQPGCWIAPDLTPLALAHTIAEALHSLTPGQRYAHAWIEPFAMPNAIERCHELICEVLA